MINILISQIVIAFGSLWLINTQKRKYAYD